MWCQPPRSPTPKKKENHPTPRVPSTKQTCTTVSPTKQTCTTVSPQRPVASAKTKLCPDSLTPAELSDTPSKTHLSSCSDEASQKRDVIISQRGRSRGHRLVISPLGVSWAWPLAPGTRQEKKQVCHHCSWCSCCGCGRDCGCSWAYCCVFALPLAPKCCCAGLYGSRP